MGTPRFTPEFKEEAVHQVTEHGYSLLKFPTVWACLRTASINGCGLSDRATANCMLGICWKPKVGS